MHCEATTIIPWKPKFTNSIYQKNEEEKKAHQALLYAKDNHQTSLEMVLEAGKDEGQNWLALDLI